MAGSLREEDPAERTEPSDHCGASEEFADGRFLFGRFLNLHKGSPSRVACSQKQSRDRSACERGGGRGRGPGSGPNIINGKFFGGYPCGTFTRLVPVLIPAHANGS